MTTRLQDLRLDIDVLVSALTIGYTVPNLIGTRVLPYYIVPADNIEAPIFGLESFREVDSHRGLRTAPAEVEFAVSSQTASLVEHALQSKVDYLEEEAGAVAGWSPRQKAANTVKRVIAINREKEIADIMQATTSYGASHSTTLTNKWDVMTTAPQSDYDPFVDIDVGIAQMRSAIGMRPNVAWCGDACWQTLKKNSFVLAAMPGGTGADSTVKRVTEAAFADLIGVDQFYIGESVYSADGAAMTDTWADDFGMLYSDPNPNEAESPAFGWTLCRQYGEVDGIPMLGVAGVDDTSGNRWWTGYWYLERYLPWVALDTAGYLIKTVNT
jgi:hypothetical protein